MRRPYSRLIAASLAGILITACVPADAGEPHTGRSPVILTAVPDPVDWSGLAAAIAVADRDRWFETAAASDAWFAEIRRQIEARKAGHQRTGSGDIEACIRRRENNNDYGRSTNPTHFGLYQYDYSTWVENGGNPDTWGSASPDEQDRVFRDTVNRHGYGPWRGDGCV